MRDVYVALLGVEFTIAVFLAAGIAAVAQVVASQVSQRTTGLIWSSRSLRVGAVVLLGASMWTLAAATVLSEWLATRSSFDVGLGALATGLAIGLSLVLLGWSLVSAVRLLDLSHALDRLGLSRDAGAWATFVIGAKATVALDSADLAAASEGLGLAPVVVFVGSLLESVDDDEAEAAVTDGADDALNVFQARLAERRKARRRGVGELRDAAAAGRLRDPAADLFEVVEKALTSSADRFERAFAKVIDQALAVIKRVRHRAISDDELRRLLSESLFEDHVRPLVRSAMDSSRVGHAGRISRVVARRNRSSNSLEVHTQAFVVVHDLARTLVDLRLPGPVCSSVEDLGELAISGANVTGGLGDQRFAEVCRALGELGQRIPSAFYSSEDPEVTISPDAEGLVPSVPLSALLNTTAMVKEELFGDPKQTLSPLIRCDAVKVTAREVSRYSRDVLRSNRLEQSLFNAVDQLQSIGLAGAKAGDDKWTMFGGFSLAGLAEDADDPLWREYPTYLGIRLAEVAVFAIDRGVTSPGFGPDGVGETLAAAIARDIPSAVGYVVGAVRAHRFDQASAEANRTLLGVLGAMP
jgi:hypothetical protein